MKLIGYREGRDRKIADLQEDGTAVPLGTADDVYARIGRGEALVTDGTPVLVASDLAQEAPVPVDANVLCVGLNYRAHAIETGAPLPERPLVFGRFPSTLVADGATVPVPHEAFDWEAELAVVIGAPARDVAADEAPAHVFGYASFNDLSARAFQGLSPQWTLGKNTDASGPMGAVTPASELGDPADGWTVRTWVDGDLVQDSDTSDLIFTIPELIAHISGTMTLRPGDVIITGTPSGVGMGMNPPRWLAPGSEVTVEIGGLDAVSCSLVEA